MVKKLIFFSLFSLLVSCMTYSQEKEESRQAPDIVRTNGTTLVEVYLKPKTQTTNWVSITDLKTQIGVETYYYENGRIRGIMPLEKGKGQGMSVFFNSDGTLRKIIFLENGLLTGMSIKLGTNGTIETKTAGRK